MQRYDTAWAGSMAKMPDGSFYRVEEVDAEIAALRTDIMNYEDRLLDENGKRVKLTAEIAAKDARIKELEESKERRKNRLGIDWQDMCRGRNEIIEDQDNRINELEAALNK